MNPCPRARPGRLRHEQRETGAQAASPHHPQGTQSPEAGPPGAETKPVRHGGEVARSTEERLTTEQPRPRTKPPVRNWPRSSASISPLWIRRGQAR